MIDSSTKEISNEELPEQIEDYFDHVTVSHDQMDWECMEAPILDVVPNSVEGAISSKEKKIQSYRDYARDLWLLVYSSDILENHDNGCVSTIGADFSDELVRASFHSSFNKVFYLDRFSKKVTELTIQIPGI
ncbi:MAG: hypothetical protein OER96_02065 [Gammaproteobacteria bacterium]|nr:hypothetical protein [Gammaproteobacteria bacterium]